MEAVVKTIGVIGIVCSFISAPCMGNELSNIDNKSMDIEPSSYIIGQSFNEPMANIHPNIDYKSQYPADLIPAIRLDRVEGRENELTTAFSIDLGLDRQLGSNLQQSSEEPSIIVEGPRFPKPAPEPTDSESRLRKVRRDINRLKVTYYVLSAVDAIATISCLSRNVCKELNPILGSRPSALKVIGVKAITGLIMHGFVQEIEKDDAYLARNTMRFGVLFQAAITGFTLNTAF
jgi:hypothetical protein